MYNFKKRIPGFVSVVCIAVMTVAGCGSENTTYVSSGSDDSGTTISVNSETEAATDSATEASTNSGTATGTKQSTDGGGSWVPDPGTVLGVEGYYYDTITESNGVTYDYYVYDFEKSTNDIGSFMVTYGEAMKTLGYTVESYNTTSSYEMYYAGYVEDDGTAEMGVFVAGSSSGETIDGDTVISWRIVLAIPTSMTFYIGSTVPGVVNGNTSCVGCNGTGNCSGCGGTGRANYGDGYETCILCDGSGVCNVCDGAGSY